MPALVGLSARWAKRLYAAVFPRRAWWVRAVLALEKLYYAATRCAFRVYAHDPARIDAVLREHGLSLASEHRTLVWQVVVYERT